MVATIQSVHDRVGELTRIQAQLSERHDLVVAAVIKMNWSVLRESFADGGRQFEIVAIPTPFAKEWRRYQEDSGYFPGPDGSPQGT